MPNPEGYRKALRLMRQAEKFRRPIFTFIDTAGAYPGLEAEEHGQGEAIARNLMEMSRLTVPVIAIITGEGNSGGALLNSKGEVIGINEAKYADEKVEGVGYAIPISHAKDIIDDLKTRTTKVEVGEEEQGYLGIQIQNIDTSMAKLYGMPEGVYVYKITEDSAAANSELKEKDIITKFDGETVRNYADLTKLLTYYKEGTTVNLTVQRLENGEYVEKEIPITLNARPQEEETAEQPE